MIEFVISLFGVVMLVYVTLQVWGWLGGMVSARQQSFQESVEAYKEALRIDSGEIDYKHNLERALEQLQQQEQEQGEDGEESEQDEEEENQDGEQDQEPQDQEQDQGEEDQEQDPNEDPNEDSPEGSPEEEESESPQQPEPGEMTQEEAERLLEGVQEDPDEVNRRQPPLRGPRPTKPW